MNKRSMFFVLGTVSLLFLIPFSISFAQTGKISGRVTDGETGEPLPGVNVILEGTQQGAATDNDGYYTIINASPGTYSMRASFIGYAETVVQEVRVQIDLTTTVNFELQPQAIAGEEVVVEAETPVVQPDVSANVANVNTQEIENIPVAGVSEFIDLQAGIEPGLIIRGGGTSELSFVVDGVNMRDGRTRSPFTNISYTSIEQLQVQTGGFNAEYGNVRSGLVNVVTKEANANQYSADLLMRYRPPQKKHFGIEPLDPNSWFMRPWLDDAVAWDGTENGDWDIYTQDQFPFFQGWNSIAENVAEREDIPDLSPQELQEIFLFLNRKETEIQIPDYEMDASLSGPVPLISQPLGDLRFVASYRQTQSAYIVPQVREGYRDWTGQIKITSDLSENKKLMLNGLYAEESGMHDSFTNMYRGRLPAYPWHGRGMVNDMGGRGAVFSGYQWPLMDIRRNITGAEFTHTLSENTFYEVKLQRNFTDYSSTRPRLRDTTTVVETIGGYELDEAPFGNVWWHSNSIAGIQTGRRWADQFDSSYVAVWTGRFDITSQVNRFTQLKAGADFSYSDYHIDYGQLVRMASIQSWFINWDRQPLQGAAYMQSKLEFQGMIANVGLRFDFFSGNGRWYDYDPYTRAFSPIIGVENLDAFLNQAPIAPQYFFSPRLGVSFPVTANSKIYFNYGHFRQMLNPDNIFEINSGYFGGVDQIGNPSHPMPRTIAYELGVEQNILNQWLLRLTGYYKDISEQPRSIGYHSLDRMINYSTVEPYNYEDIRGFELTLRKNRGQWYRGFINYTYMVSKGGVFGFGEQYENRASQRQYIRENGGAWQFTSTPEPFGRFNLEFLMPPNLGPTVMGIKPLGDWRFNLLGEWRAGQLFTWTAGETVRGLNNNVQWKDFFMLDIRLSKNFTTDLGSIRLFADFNNILNLKYLNRYSAFIGDRDFEKYMMSLHLPEDTFEEMENPPYAFIPGDDRPGDYRKTGVEYVPVEIVDEIESVTNPHERPLYYESNNEQYMTWTGSEWTQPEQNVVDQVLEDKAYINMPNATHFTFLNPRSVRLGIRITF